uniref:Uncharacterized protein n=1 Tax=Arundo donax TaxID=35708 RepID=A0A0A9EVJ6_ARUDO
MPARIGAPNRPTNPSSRRASRVLPRSSISGAEWGGEGIVDREVR